MCHYWCDTLSDSQRTFLLKLVKRSRNLCWRRASFGCYWNESSPLRLSDFSDMFRLNSENKNGATVCVQAFPIFSQWSNVRRKLQRILSCSFRGKRDSVCEPFKAATDSRIVNGRIEFICKYYDSINITKIMDTYKKPWLNRFNARHVIHENI